MASTQCPSQFIPFAISMRKYFSSHIFCSAHCVCVFEWRCAAEWLERQTRNVHMFWQTQFCVRPTFKRWIMERREKIVCENIVCRKPHSVDSSFFWKSIINVYVMHFKRYPNTSNTYAHKCRCDKTTQTRKPYSGDALCTVSWNSEKSLHVLVWLVLIEFIEEHTNTHTHIREFACSRCWTTLNVDANTGLWE